MTGGNSRDTVNSYSVVLIVLVLGLLPAQVGAQEPDATLAPTALSEEALKAHSFTLEQLESVAENTESTLTEAEERVALDLLYEEVITFTEQQYPDTFGGYEIKPTGASALALYFTRHHEASLAAVQAAFPHVIRLSSKQVENTQAELWAMYYDLAFAAPGEGLLARLAPTDLDIGTIGLNLAANTVDIHALNYETLARRDVAPTITTSDADLLPAPGVAERVQSEASVAVDPSLAPDAPLPAAGLLLSEEVRLLPQEQLPQTTACTSRMDCNSVRGGINIKPRSGGDCTLGYTAYNKTSGAPYVVTNAHCGARTEYQEYLQGDPLYVVGGADLAIDRIFGTSPSGHPYGYDAVRIREYGPDVGIRPFIWSNTPEYHVWGVGDPSLHREGVERCYAGAVTNGQECGPSGYGPAMKDATDSDGVRYSNAHSYSFSTICIPKGDSGSPVYRGGFTDGMLFSSNTNLFGGCTGFSGSHYNLTFWTADALNLRVFLAQPCSNRPPVTC